MIRAVIRLEKIRLLAHATPFFPDPRICLRKQPARLSAAGKGRRRPPVTPAPRVPRRCANHAAQVLQPLAQLSQAGTARIGRRRAARLQLFAVEAR